VWHTVVTGTAVLADLWCKNKNASTFPGPVMIKTMLVTSAESWSTRGRIDSSRVYARDFP
jgi:hypothetical protein